MAASLRRFVSRLRLAFGSRRAEQELTREIAAHVSVLEDEYRRRGLSDEEARYAARRAMGSVEHAKELQRDARAFAWVAGARRDCALAVQALARSRGATALAVLTLGLGIGATTAVYTALDAALLRPLPFPEPEQLVQTRGFVVPLDLPASGLGQRPTAPPDIRDLAAMRGVFSSVAAHATGAMNLGSGAQPLRVNVTFVTGDFFATLGRPAHLGRVIGGSDAVAGAPPVAVLSYDLWRTQFGADPAIVGRSVRLDTRPHEVIGVMPAGLRFPALAQLWVPLPVPAPMAVMSAFRNFLPAVLIGRLAPGVPPAVAADRVDAAYASLSNAAAVSARRGGPPEPRIVPLQRSLLGDRRTTLLVLMVSAGLLLVIACANAATLLLARASARRRELATHAVLGATRRRIVFRLLVESVLLAGAGAVLGIAIAMTGVSLMADLLPSALAGIAPLRVDVRVLAFAVALAAATGVGFGLWPAVQGSRIELQTALRDAGARTFTGSRASGPLVVVQVALACVLTIGATLMITSLRSLLATDLGMRIEDVATARMNLPPATYADAAAVARFVSSAIEGITASASVADAAAVNTLPLAREAYVSFRLDHEGATERHVGEPRHSSPYLVVSPNYFRTMGIPLLRGRDLAWSDGASVPVAVINRTMAQRFWPGEDPIGKRFLMTDLRTVVGVVGDAQFGELGTDGGPQVYLPIQEQPQNYVSLVARRDDGASLEAAIDQLRVAVGRVDADLPLYAAQPMTDVVAEALAPRRLNTMLLALFGAAALTLAAIGVYGVLACSVAQRTREIGVRMALGAQRRQVLAFVLRQGTTLLAAGIGLGMAAAVLGVRALQGMLYGVGSRDPVTFAVVGILLAAVGLFAAIVPARRAAAADPLTALRAE